MISTNRKLKAVIFDLDGTITQPLLDFDQIRAELGIKNPKSTILEEMREMTDEQVKSCFEIIDRHEKHAAFNSTLNHNAHQTITAIRDMGLKIGLLTRNTRENAMIVAEKHNLVFDEIFDRNDGPVKPDPFGVIHLCNKFDTTPDNALVVGDFIHDLQTAKASGSIAVLIKTHPNADEFAPLADYVIDSLDQIIEIINR